MRIPRVGAKGSVSGLREKYLWWKKAKLRDGLNGWLARSSSVNHRGTHSNLEHRGSVSRDLCFGPNLVYLPHFFCFQCIKVFQGQVITPVMLVQTFNLLNNPWPNLANA